MLARRMSIEDSSSNENSIMSTIATATAHDVRTLGHFVGGESVAGAPGRADPFSDV